jgi:hypothetical protein
MGGLDTFVEKTLAAMFGILLATHVLVRGMFKRRLALAAAQIYARRRGRGPELPSGRVYLFIPCYLLCHTLLDVGIIAKGVVSADYEKYFAFTDTSSEILMRSAASYLLIEVFIRSCTSHLAAGISRDRMAELARYILSFAVQLVIFGMAVTVFTYQLGSDLNNQYLELFGFAWAIFLFFAYLIALPRYLERTFLALGAVARPGDTMSVFQKADSAVPFFIILSFTTASQLRLYLHLKP